MDIRRSDDIGYSAFRPNGAPRTNHGVRGIRRVYAGCDFLAPDTLLCEDRGHGTALIIS